MGSEIELPRGWAAATLSQVLEPRREKENPSDRPDLPFIGMDHVESHTTRLLGTIPASAMKSPAVRFLSGDVLYGRLRPYLNKVAVPNFDGLASAEFIVLPESECVSSSFLKHRLSAVDIVNFASHLNEGDRPRVSFDQIGRFKILIPPLHEQRRIVNRIDELFSELDAGIKSLQTARGLLAIYRQSVLKHAFEGKLTVRWREERTNNLELSGRLLCRILQERETRYEQTFRDRRAAIVEWRDQRRCGARPRKPKRRFLVV